MRSIKLCTNSAQFDATQLYHRVIVHY